MNEPGIGLEDRYIAWLRLKRRLFFRLSAVQFIAGSKIHCGLIMEEVLLVVVIDGPDMRTILASAHNDSTHKTLAIMPGPCPDKNTSSYTINSNQFGRPMKEVGMTKPSTSKSK